MPNTKSKAKKKAKPRERWEDPVKAKAKKPAGGELDFGALDVSFGDANVDFGAMENAFEDDPIEDDNPLTEARKKLVGNLEQDARTEWHAMKQAFRDAAQAAVKREALEGDSEYWICLSFQTREQKEEFIGKLGMTLAEDKYLDGVDVASRVGIELKTPNPKFSKSRHDKTWAQFVDPKQGG